MGRLVLAFMEAKKGAIAVLAQAGPDSSNLAGMKLRYGYPPPTLTMGSECVTESVVSALIGLQMLPTPQPAPTLAEGKNVDERCAFRSATSQRAATPPTQAPAMGPPGGAKERSRAATGALGRG